MIINHNMPAMNGHRQLKINTGNGQKSIEKLSSGLRINRAGDDAAGLAISEKMRGQIRGLNQASRNAQDGISMIQTAEGALTETHAILQRMRELTVQASNDTNISADRAQIGKEVAQLKKELDRIGNTTEFNKQKLLNGKLSGTSGIAFQIGANTGQTFSFYVGDMRTSALVAGNSLTAVASIMENESGINGVSLTKYVEVIDKAIEKVSGQRANLGAMQNRLEHTIKNLDVASENLQAAESRIRDVDMAKEMMNFTKNNILQQAAQSMLAQANQAPQGVLSLLR